MARDNGLDYLHRILVKFYEKSSDNLEIVSACSRNIGFYLTNADLANIALIGFPLPGMSGQ